MPCQTCAAAAELETCLFCGLVFCPLHRGELGGAVTCTGCLKAEHARKQAGAAGRAGSAQDTARARSGAGAAAAPQGVRFGAAVSEPAATPPPLLEEPRVWGPLLWAAAAAAPAGAYLHWLLGWLVETHGVAPWARSAGTIAGVALVAFGVWAIAKSR